MNDITAHIGKGADGAPKAVIHNCLCKKPPYFLTASAPYQDYIIHKRIKITEEDDMGRKNDRWEWHTCPMHDVTQEARMEFENTLKMLREWVE